MLQLKDIQKTYLSGENAVQALKSVSLSFRRNEFVSILGPSGCGKTTLLNIIGGLDRYTSGDLVIDGTSTKQYRDGDWDVYRNRSIGFVFQSYNLIPHQSVLSNVELALTLSGVSKAERRARATEVLEKVGLGDQLHKRPNQMSGGQMQRVAIARALINNPEILLADEPTGALDSETSVQIMETLKEIAADRLVIMVTHNPELAERYSTRIIRLLDGSVIDDSNPYDPAAEPQTAPEKPDEQPAAKSKQKRRKKTPLRYRTALSLSLNNLMTKKARTFMTAFAGSIGIIGIALILSISSGMQAYIDRVQEETLSSYPIAIEQNTVDFSSMMATMIENQEAKNHGDDTAVYSNDIMRQMLDLMVSGMTSNNLEPFKTYVEDPANGFSDLTNDIQYSYRTPLYIYRADTENGVKQVNPSTVFQSLGFPTDAQTSQMASMNPMLTGAEIWTPLLNNEELLRSQYEITGSLPQNENQIVLLVDENNEITDYALYALGLKDVDELTQVMEDLRAGKEVDLDGVTQARYTTEELLNLRFKLVLNTDFYAKENGVWVDKREDAVFMKDVIDKATEVEVVGILRPAPDAVATSITGTVAYQPALMESLIRRVNESEIVREQQAHPDTDVFSGKPFPDGSQELDLSTLPPEQQAYLAGLSEAERQNFIRQYQEANFSAATYDGNLETLGVASLDSPSGIQLYAKDFDTKEQINDLITQYNKAVEDDGREEDVIQYTDYIGLMMSSVSTIIDVISYILIAFVAISLVVSSIMIGIITYISVLERTKEIGILRSIGASKKDISRVFNAETLIVGFAAGIIGIGVTLLLNIPINLIISHFADVSNVAALPPLGGLILVLISMALTLIAGLIPAKIAAKKDPVEALRTE